MDAFVQFMVLRIADVGLRVQRAERARVPIGKIERLPIAELGRQDCSRLSFFHLYGRIDIDVIVQRRMRARCMDGEKQDNAAYQKRALAVRHQVVSELDAARLACESEATDDDRQRTGHQMLVDLLMEQKGELGSDYHRSGKELWAFLRPRLKFIVQLQEVSKYSLLPVLYGRPPDRLIEYDATTGVG
eukprot:SAG11_NODE_1102_length_5866_cov_2.173574_8_plen_188_part_00